MLLKCSVVNCKIQTFDPALINADLESDFIHSKETLSILKGQ